LFSSQPALLGLVPKQLKATNVEINNKTIRSKQFCCAELAKTTIFISHLFVCFEEPITIFVSILWRLQQQF
jgi:hypothetical protein